MKLSLLTLMCLVAVVTVSVCGCQSRRQQINHRGAWEFDTLAVMKTLALGSDDSLRIHYPADSTDFDNMVTDLQGIATLSPTLAPFCYRAVISVWRGSSVSDGGSLVFLYNNESDPSKVKRLTVDSVEIWIGALSSFNPKIQVADLNFDRYQDIKVSFTENTSGRTGFNLFWTFDSTRNSFKPDSALNALFKDAEIFVDTESRVISTGGRIGAAGFSGEEYKWDGNQYVLFARIQEGYNDDGSLFISRREELVNGTWTVVQADSTPNQ